MSQTAGKIPAQPGVRDYTANVSNFGELQNAIGQALQDGDAHIYINNDIDIVGTINITGTSGTEVIRLIGSPDNMPVLKRTSSFINYFFSVENVILRVENIILDGNLEEINKSVNCKSLICPRDKTKLYLGGNTILKNNYSGAYWLGGGAICTEGDITEGVEITMSDSARITGNETDGYGGGINIGVNGVVVGVSKIIMTNNSSIDGNTAQRNGGGVYATHTNIEMFDHSIIKGNNSVREGGGGLFAVRSPHITISQNSRIVLNEAAEHGGGIVTNNVYGSEASMMTLKDDASIENNTTRTRDGGGIYLQDEIIFTMADQSKLCGNKSYGNGGGLFAAHPNSSDGATIIINGETQICDNETLYGNGGGLYLNTKNTTISGTASFKSNKAPNANGGAIGLETRNELHVGPGVTFSENKAAVAYDFNEADRESYEENIEATVFSYGFKEGYNNYDIQYSSSQTLQPHNITYTDGEGEEVVYPLFDGQTLKDIPPPARENAQFRGWYADEAHNNKLDEYAPIAQDMTVYPLLECNAGYTQVVADGKITCEKVLPQWRHKLSHIDGDGVCPANAAMHYYRAGTLVKEKPDVCDLFMLSLVLE
ncbi:MAG: hypothetical protein LBS72_00385 [Oscillospiraceae bacterium]|jgi:hypothetical protein|nr:hypothetical protein [Oscillospiraceae bacterium]